MRPRPTAVEPRAAQSFNTKVTSVSVATTRAVTRALALLTAGQLQPLGEAAHKSAGSSLSGDTHCGDYSQCLVRGEAPSH